MVKNWKLFESCGVQIITFTTTQLILLVERRYTLTRFTLDQMLNNVRLEVEEESKVSLELLSFGVDAAKDIKENMLNRDDRYGDDPIRSLGLKIEILEFTGKVYLDDFIDWLSTVERVFDVRDILNKLKVKLVAIKLQQHASLWRDHVNKRRRIKGKSKNMTMEEVINVFDKLCMRCDVVEEEEQVIAWFLGVLKLEITDI
nr:hypothetical protein [Tanacetum cinerariifolium]